jgi:hypothetical protein
MFLKGNPKIHVLVEKDKAPLNLPFDIRKDKKKAGLAGGHSSWYA